MLAVFGKVGDPVRHRVGWGGDLLRPPVDADRAAVQRIGAEDRAGDLGAACAHQAREAQDLALVQREADVADRGAPVQAFDGSYDAAVATLKKAAAAKGSITGWGLSALAEVSLYEQKDTTGRPLYVPNINSAANTGSILGKPVYIADPLAYSSTTAADTVGIAGNWSELMWGYVEGISYEEYDGPIFAQNGTLIHAGRQDNMSTLIVEFEVGSLIRKPNQFVRLVEDDKNTAGLQPELADTP